MPLSAVQHQQLQQFFSAFQFKEKGAGDSEMDAFLNSVGQAVHVGNPFLTFEGAVPALKIGSSAELGELIYVPWRKCPVDQTSNCPVSKSKYP